ncbi:hypothetical protein ACJX0J_022014, partial [Zea mays]
KKVFPDFYVLGWYSTGSDVHDTDMQIHKALMDVNESPVYLLLNPTINLSQKDLPVTIYESELHVIDGCPQLIFVRSNYTIETVEAERISVDHVAHLKPSDGGSAATQLAAHLTGIHSAIKMLNSRVRVIHQYLVAMQKGDIPMDNSLLRQVSSLVRRLPATESQKFQDDFLMEYNDTLLMTYLAMFTNCSRSHLDINAGFRHDILLFFHLILVRVLASPTAHFYASLIKKWHCAFFRLCPVDKENERADQSQALGSLFPFWIADIDGYTHIYKLGILGCSLLASNLKRNGYEVIDIGRVVNFGDQGNERGRQAAFSS